MPEVIYSGPRGTGASAKVVLDTKPLDKLKIQCPIKADNIVRKTAFTVEKYAKMLSAVDTSAMRNSIHTSTSRGSNAGEAIARASSLRPNVVMGEAPESKELGLAYVGVGVEYGIYVEFGTSRTPAQPFMVPAVEMGERDMIEFAKQEFKE